MISTTIMRRSPTALAAAGLLALGVAACASGASSPPACTTNATFARQVAQQQADMQHASNSDPIPPHAYWPTKAADLASSPQVDPSDQGAVNSLYWDRQAQNLGSEMQSEPSIICGEMK